MAELLFDADANAELVALESDPTCQGLVQALENRVFRLLALDPTDPSLRRRRFSNGLWIVTVWVGTDEISVLWDGEDVPESVIIKFIGKLPHR